MATPAWPGEWHSECPLVHSNQWNTIITRTRGMNHKLLLGLMTPEANSTVATICIACRTCGYFTHNYPRKLAEPCRPLRAQGEMGCRATSFIATNRHPGAHEKLRKHVRVDGPGWFPFERTLHRMRDGMPFIPDSEIFSDTEPYDP